MVLTRERVLEMVPTLPPGVQTLAELDRLGQGVSEIRIRESAALIRRTPGWPEAVMDASRRLSGRIRAGRPDPFEEAVALLKPVELLWVTGGLALQPWLDRPLSHYGIPANALREPLLRAAFYTGRLATAVGLEESTGYLAGLLQGTGRFVLEQLAALSSPKQGVDPPEINADITAWELRTFGVAACEVGAWVLSAGGFRSDLVAAVQHQQAASPMPLKSKQAVDPGPPFRPPPEVGGYDVRGDFTCRSSAEEQHDRLACLLALARGMAAADGFPFPGETGDESARRSTWLQAGFADLEFEKAKSDARGAYLGWREAGRLPSEGVSQRSELTEAAQTPVFPAPDEDSCNFSRRSGVLRANDALPVQTSEPGVASPAPDFTTFMRNYQNMVFSTAARLTGNDAQAEDISQEVFLKAYENYAHLSTSPTAGGWLKTVATNLSLNHLSRYRNRWRFFSEFKRESDESDASDLPEVEFAAPDTFFSGVDADERRAFVERALAELPPNQRVPLVLYHFEDMPYDEIAKKLGVSLAKVKTDILRARAALAKVLVRSGTVHEKFSL